MIRCDEGGGEQGLDLQVDKEGPHREVWGREQNLELGPRIRRWGSNHRGG